MNEIEFLTEWIEDLARDVRREIEPLTLEQLSWQPDPEANNISLTVWHFSRWLDVLCVRILQNRPTDEEQWITGGWMQKTSYDPRGVGFAGVGAITGYTLEEALAVPILSAADLLGYLDALCAALADQVRGLSPGALHQPTPGLQNIQPGGYRLSGDQTLAQGRAISSGRDSSAQIYAAARGGSSNRQLITNLSMEEAAHQRPHRD